MSLYQSTSTGRRNENYLYSGDIVKTGHQVVFRGQQALSTTEIAVHGHVYRIGTILLKKWIDEAIPVFLLVDQIIVSNNEKLLKCIELQVDFNEHVNAFRLVKKLQESVEYGNTSSSSMTYRWPH